MNSDKHVAVKHISFLRFENNSMSWIRIRIHRVLTKQYIFHSLILAKWSAISADGSDQNLFTKV
jgi:hypothetical protein